MEQQAIETQDTAIVREQLIAIIKNSYAASNQLEQKQAQQKLESLLKTPAFLQKLVFLLTDTKEGYLKNDLEKGVASLIKKYSYEYAKTQDDKTNFIQTIIKLILTQHISFGAKELLGIALEHQFNQDQENRYRPAVMVKVFNLLALRENLVNLEGLVIICIAYINSLVQVEQQIDFFMNSLQTLNIASINLLRQVDKMGIQEFLSKTKALIPKMSKIFEYIELAAERIMDEEMYMTQQLKTLRENKFLISILENYLPLFSNNGSLISLQCPEINQIKRIITNVVHMLYRKYLCPSNIFNTIYITFLVQSQYQNRDCNVQSIIIHCCEILTFHLQKKYNYKLFADNIDQTILALFMYSTTSKQEYEALDNNPQEFSDIAEYCVKGQQKYYNLKVKASLFLQMAAEKIDGALKQMLQIIIVIITSSLQFSANDSDIMKEVKQQSSKFDFYGLSKQKKLETSFMILCSVSHYINRRPDTAKLIYSLLVSQFDVFSKITSSIVVLRLLRIASCYPSALYFNYVQNQIRKGRVFAIQGIRCFQKIIRTNKYHELFKSLAHIISNIIDYVAVTDPIMQLMVTKQFQQMLKASSSLFQGVLRKIRGQFYKNVQTHQHQTLVCLNLIYYLLSREKQEEYIKYILSVFYEWVKFLQLPQNLKIYHKYDQKIAQMFQFIIKKEDKVNEQTHLFVKYSLGNLSNIDKGSQYFRFYSVYMLHSTGSNIKLGPLFSAFLNETKSRFLKLSQGQPYSEGISYFCFLLSTIISSYGQLQICENDLNFLLQLATKVPIQFKQYPLIVFLTHLYQFPNGVRAYLNQKSIYGNFLNEVVRINFDNGIIKKIFILSLIKLLEIQENPDYFKIILVYCINHLKNQVQDSIKLSKKRPVLEYRRALPLERETQKVTKQEQIENDVDNQMVNIFTKFKHPLGSISDFDQFKVIVWHNEQQISMLSKEMKEDIKRILEMEWVQNKTRRIVHVKK